MKFDTKALLPHIIAIVVFVALSIAYFSPILEGYSLRMGDIMSHRGMAKESIDYRAFNDDEPFWTNSMFGGMPAYHISLKTHGNLLAAVFMVKDVIPIPAYFFLIMMISFYILMMTLKVRPYLAIVGSVAFAFSTFFLVSIEAGHTSKIHAICFLPLVVAGIIQILNSKYLIGGLIFTIGLSLQLKANHFQITYYTMIFSLIYVIYFYIVKFKSEGINYILRSGTVFLVGALLALGTNVTNLWMTYEYSKSTTRGKSELTITAQGSSNELNKSGGLDKDYITRWSLGLGETWSLIIPNIKGGANGRIGNNEKAMASVSNQFKQYVAQSSSYWGNQPFTSGPTYLGAFIFLLFVLGMVTLKNKMKWPILGAVVLFVMLSWGHNLMWFSELFIDNVPMYNKFRSVTMTLVMVQFLVPLVGILFLNQIFESDFFEKEKKKILITTGVVAALILVVVVSPSSFFDFLSTREQDQFIAQQESNPAVSGQIDQLILELTDARKSILKGDGLRSLLLILAGFGLVFAAGIKKLKFEIAVLGIFALTLFDLWSVDKRYLNNEKYKGKYLSWVKKEELLKPYRAKPYDLQILNNEKAQIATFNEQVKEREDFYKSEKGRLSQIDKEGIQFEVLNLNTNYRVFNLAESVFNSSESAYFHKSIGGYHPAKLMRYQELIDFYLNPNTGQFNSQILNMLNTKYVVVRDEGGKLQQNPSAFGNAWLVNQLDWVDSADDEVQRLGNVDLKSTAVIDKRFEGQLSGVNIGSANSGTIYLTSYSPKELSYAFNSSSDQYAVFSEMYYQPGWNAYIDGNLVDHQRVNYVLRGMHVPSGNHKIEFKFEPSTYSIGEGISYASSILILLFAIGVGYKAYKKEEA